MDATPVVFLVDDDAATREAISRLLRSKHFRVEPYSSASEFLDACDPAMPGCLVLDIRMPGMSGLELQQRIADLGFCLPIILVTGHGNVSQCAEAFRRGAFDFLEKPVDERILVDRVQRAIEEDARLRDTRAKGPPIGWRLSQLTPREREVLNHLLDGTSIKQIAAELRVSFQTVSRHRNNVLKKLQVDNEVQLVYLMLPFKKN